MDFRKNIYTQNNEAGVGYNPLMRNPDASDLEFVAIANKILKNAVDLIRIVIPSHQSAIAVIIDHDWSTVRKFFSLSRKYDKWRNYAEPATGYGIHNFILKQKGAIRLTQSELESHPEFKYFGVEKEKHPPMRGWLAAPILDASGRNWGLIQLSDKLEGDYDDTDETLLMSFTSVVSMALELAWKVREQKKAFIERDEN